jgi:ferredoxin
LPIRRRVLGKKKKFDDWNGIPREDIPWYPTVDKELCTACGVCIEFCSNNALGGANIGQVYVADEEGKPDVVNPFGCVLRQRPESVCAAAAEHARRSEYSSQQ